MTPTERGPADTQALPTRQGLLAACLVAIIVAYPLAKDFFPGFKLLLEIFLVMVLAAAAYAFVARRVLFYLMLALLIMGLGLLSFSIEYGSSQVRLVGGLALALYLALTVYSLQVRLWRLTKISIDAVVVSFNGYLILGLIWGILFQCIELAIPGSFHMASGYPLPTDMLEYTNQQWSSFFYFSMVTLTTLGYGDVTPASLLARNLAILEAVLGQFYLAVVVARLVGLLSNKSQSSVKP